MTAPDVCSFPTMLAPKLVPTHHDSCSWHDCLQLASLRKTFSRLPKLSSQINFCLLTLLPSLWSCCPVKPWEGNFCWTHFYCKYLWNFSKSCNVPTLPLPRSFPPWGLGQMTSPLCASFCTCRIITELSTKYRYEHFMLIFLKSRVPNTVHVDTIKQTSTRLIKFFLHSWKSALVPSLQENFITNQWIFFCHLLSVTNINGWPKLYISTPCPPQLRHLGLGLDLQICCLSYLNSSKHKEFLSFRAICWNIYGWNNMSELSLKYSVGEKRVWI